MADTIDQILQQYMYGNVINPQQSSISSALTGGTPGTGMGWGDMSLYGKMGTVGMGVQAATGLFDILNSWKQNKMAGRALSHNIGMDNKRYANEVKSYDNMLMDRYAAGASAAAARGKSYGDMASYMAPRSLTGKLA